MVTRDRPTTLEEFEAYISLPERRPNFILPMGHAWCGLSCPNKN